MAQTPAAMQLRLFQTVAEVAAEKNSTLVLPFPVEQIGPISAEVGIPAPPEMTFYEVHNYLTAG